MNLANPAEMLTSVNIALCNLLSVQSQDLYEQTYNVFDTWCTERYLTNYIELVFRVID